MNKQRRSEIQKAVNDIYDALATLECVKDDEESAFDNMPDSFQCSERGEQMSENIDTLQEICETLLDYTTMLEEM